MTTDIMGRSPTPDRPLGISILAVLACIPLVAVLLVLLSGQGGVRLDAVASFITVLGAMTAYGLWNMRPWAWPLALAIWAIATLDAVLLLMGNVFNSNLVVGPIVVIYLLQPSIRSLFRRGG